MVFALKFILSNFSVSFFVEACLFMHDFAYHCGRAVKCVDDLGKPRMRRWRGLRPLFVAFELLSPSIVIKKSNRWGRCSHGGGGMTPAIQHRPLFISIIKNLFMRNEGGNCAIIYSLFFGYYFFVLVFVFIRRLTDLGCVHQKQSFCSLFYFFWKTFLLIIATEAESKDFQEAFVSRSSSLDHISCICYQLILLNRIKLLFILATRRAFPASFIAIDADSSLLRRWRIAGKV